MGGNYGISVLIVVPLYRQLAHIHASADCFQGILLLINEEGTQNFKLFFLFKLSLISLPSTTILSNFTMLRLGENDKKMA